MKIRFSNFIAFLCVATLVSSVARADVLIQAPGANADEYLAMVKTDDSVHSLVEELETSRPSDSDKQSLLMKFEQAQNFYLSGKETEATRAFQDVVAMAHNADWRETERQALLYSYLRLAQLSADAGTREQIFQKAARFAPDIEPEPNLFPPPHLKAYRQIRAQELSRTTAFHLSEKFPGYDVVIVDGRRYDALTDDQMSLTVGEHRLSLLSNSRAPLTQMMTSSQLNVFKLDSKPLAAGDCDEPSLVGFQDLGLKTARVFYDRNCIRTYTGTGWLKTQAGSFDQPGLATPPSDFSHAMQTEAPAPKVSSAHTWIWIGVGAALVASAALVYAHEHRGGERVEPVQKQGY